MRYGRALFLALLVPLVVACTAMACVAGPQAESASGGGSATSSSSSSGEAPSTCAQVDQGIGCCFSTDTLYYCTNTGSVYRMPCAPGTACGWNATEKQYDCVAPPGAADPDNTYPLRCDALSSSSSSGSGSSSSGSSSSSSGSSSSSSSSGSSSSGVTWTTLYDTIFGPTGTSNCTGTSCHATGQMGFTSGTTKASCYTGMVNKGLITPGANASSSELVTPGSSPLCGSLGGNMPLVGPCLTDAQLTEVKSWLATGAPDN